MNEQDLYLNQTCQFLIVLFFLAQVSIQTNKKLTKSYFKFLASVFHISIGNFLKWDVVMFQVTVISAPCGMLLFSWLQLDPLQVGCCYSLG